MPRPDITLRCCCANKGDPRRLDPVQPTANLAPPSPGVVSLNLTLGAHSRPFCLFDTQLGNIVTREVFSGKSYPLMPLTGEVRTIVDIGANIGAATLYFALHYPQARIFSFEPAPNCYALLAQNIRGLSSIRSFPFGLSDRAQSVPLFLGQHDEVTNSIGHSSLNSTSSVMVE